jgi:hypothetical protein
MPKPLDKPITATATHEVITQVGVYQGEPDEEGNPTARAEYRRQLGEMDKDGNFVPIGEAEIVTIDETTGPKLKTEVGKVITAMLAN